MSDWQLQDQYKSGVYGSAGTVNTVPTIRTWRWIAALGGILFMLVLVIAIVFFVALMGRLGAQPLHMALEKIRQDPQATERLGEPIKMASWLPMGSVNADGDRGEANLTFRIQGPRDTATVNLVARLIAGRWGLTSLEVTYSDGKRQVFDVSENGDEELDAPRWTPQAGGDTPQPNMSDSNVAAQKQADSQTAPPDVTVPTPSVDIKLPDVPGR